MIKTLTKHGNSYAMVIDKPILELLKATPETRFEIISDGRSLVLTPVRDPEEEKKFDWPAPIFCTSFNESQVTFRSVPEGEA